MKLFTHSKEAECCECSLGQSITLVEILFLKIDLKDHWRIVIPPFCKSPVFCIFDSFRFKLIYELVDPCWLDHQSKKCNKNSFVHGMLQLTLKPDIW